MFQCILLAKGYFNQSFNVTTVSLAIIGTTGCTCITMITQLDKKAMSYQAQVVIYGTTIYHLMLRPETLAITGTTECKCITCTTCFNYWHHMLLDVILVLQNVRALLALQDAYVLL